MFGVRHDSSCFSSCLSWALLLCDSIIFQKRTKPEQTTKLKNGQPIFLDFQAEKSFNRQPRITTENQTTNRDLEINGFLSKRKAN